MLWSELERFGRFWDPWRDFERMSRAISKMSATPAYDFPLINLWIAGDKALVTTEVPGIEPDKIEINVVDSTLVLSGERTPGTVKEGETYHRRERWQGKFAKTVELPFRVEVEKVSAKYRKGILSVELPRAEADKPKKISISAK